MLIRGWPQSSNARLASAEGGNFFFQPGQLHLQPADLLEELRRLLLTLLVRRFELAREDRLHPFHELLLPQRDQRRMYLIPTRQFADRLLALQGRQSHRRLEVHRERSPFPTHPQPSRT